MVGVGLTVQVGGRLADLLELFGGGAEEAVGLGLAAAVAVDGDPALGEFLGAFGFVAPELGEGREQQAQFADVGEALVVLRVVRTIWSAASSRIRSVRKSS